MTTRDDDEETVDREAFMASVGARREPPLPWIGALPNPHLGPIVVVGENGYLVPLFTAADLLRGCRYFWAR